MQHKAFELWRKLRSAIKKKHDLKAVILNHEKVGVTLRDRSREFFSGISLRKSSGNFGEGFWIEDKDMLLQKRVSEVVEALRIKHLGTGHNLLMYAASKGRADSFNSLVNIVKQRVSFERISSSGDR